MKKHFPNIACKDGTRLSVQASEYNYSSPRDDKGPYTTAEIGFPTAVPTGELLTYAEDKDKPTDTVYGYVPIHLIEQFINDHGGIDLANTL